MLKQIALRASQHPIVRRLPQFIRGPISSTLKAAGCYDPRINQIGIGPPRREDVFLASYPKSGNTWLRFMIGYLLQPAAELSFKNIDQLIPDPERADCEVAKMKPPRMIKTHWPYFDLFPRCIYIVRDPRDVYVSYYHYCVNNGWYNGNIENFVSVTHPYGDWADHVNQFLTEQSRRSSDFLFFRYEDVLLDPASVARAVAVFLDLSPSDAMIKSAVERSSFSALSKKEAEHGPERGTTGAFFRQGRAGEWRSVLPQKTADVLAAKYRTLLQRLEYDEC